MRVVIRNVLSKIDMAVKHVYEAINGREGLKILKNNPVDLILTDIDMPEMSGLEMLGYIRAHPDFEDVPTVVISSIKDDRLVEAVTKSGMGYVNKPLSEQLLKSQISSLEGWSYETGAQSQDL